MQKNRARRAFTIIELLIVVAISAMLSTLAITFSSVGKNQVALSVEGAKIGQFILQAKQLAIATYGAGGNCGYGVSINMAAQTYSIFAYTPAGAPPCIGISSTTAHLASGILNSEEQQYSPSTWNIPVAHGVVVQSQIDSLLAVIFYPPDPTTFLSHDGI